MLKWYRGVRIEGVTLVVVEDRRGPLHVLAPKSKHMVVSQRSRPYDWGGDTAGALHLAAALLLDVTDDEELSAALAHRLVMSRLNSYPDNWLMPAYVLLDWLCQQPDVCPGGERDRVLRERAAEARAYNAAVYGDKEEFDEG